MNRMNLPCAIRSNCAGQGSHAIRADDNLVYRPPPFLGRIPAFVERPGLRNGLDYSNDDVYGSLVYRDILLIVSFAGL